MTSEEARALIATSPSDKMKHLAAYLLLGVGGNASPSAKDVKKVLAAVGIEADDDRLKQLISELEGKDINEVRFPPPRRRAQLPRPDHGRHEHC